MRFNIYLFIIMLFVSFILSAAKADAFMKQTNPSATLVPTVVEKKKDVRVEKLRAYLEYNNSPMTEDAESFIAYADKYNLDWKLVVSIAGVESGYGKQIPAYSYNAWGWGVYGDNVIRFDSWDAGIAEISRGLREDYMDKRGAKTTHDIGRTYAANPKWASKVEYFMDRLEDFDPASLEKDPVLTVAL
jgi:beta-N-acetylglucosaminidase